MDAAKGSRGKRSPCCYDLLAPCVYRVSSRTVKTYTECPNLGVFGRLASNRHIRLCTGEAERWTGGARHTGTNGTLELPIVIAFRGKLSCHES